MQSSNAVVNISTIETLILLFTLTVYYWNKITIELSLILMVGYHLWNEISWAHRMDVKRSTNAQSRSKSPPPHPRK